MAMTMQTTYARRVATVAPFVAIVAAAAGEPGDGPGLRNHPVGVVATESVVVPAHWPLDRRGAITCLTCHTKIPEKKGVFDAKLRETGTPGAEFCTKCHDTTLSGSVRSIHWLAVGIAHVPDDDRSSRGGGRALDASTRQCLSCHDGATATESKNLTTWSGTKGYVGDKRRDHPVGVRYDRMSRPKDASPLRPASLVPAHVLLPDGRVSCISCHDLYAATPSLLSVPVQDSKLCLTCHDMG